MKRHLNVEVKARLRDPEKAREKLLSLGAREIGTFTQVDYYFEVPRGRLKLREVEGSDKAELIYYERADEPGPRPCDATIIELPRREAEPLKHILPVRGVVRKRRTILKLGQAEIHIDDVENVGHLIELEIRTGPELGVEEAERMARELLAELGVREEDLVPYSNVDLVLKATSGGQAGLKVLWAPWRMTYITSAGQREGCLFCELKEPGRDEENKVIYRGRTCYVVLNIYPYNTGHVMVAPYRHVGDPCELTREELEELWETVNLAIKAIRLAYGPHGFNVGMNIGRVAGAGVEDHLHVHVVPRWLGDTNFMPVIASTKVISQHIDEMYRALKDAFEKVLAGRAEEA